jgi:hypothetical protein
LAAYDAQPCARAERPPASLPGALVAALLGARSTQLLEREPVLSRTIRCAIPAVVLLLMLGCAPSAMHHAFSFDARADSSDVEVLDFRYGDSKLPATRPSDRQLRDGQVPQYAIVGGPMPRPSSLYVKWRLKSTNQVYEDAVDLRNRLPRDITDHRVYFLISGPQLYVYLVTPERIPNGNSPGPISRYSHLKTITVYPDNSQK